MSDPAPVSTPTLRGDRLTMRPVGEDDLDPLAAMIDLPGIHEWWDSDEGEERREGLRCDTFDFAIEVDGELAGWLAVNEEDTPDYRHASIDLFLAPTFHGAGHGPAALRLVAVWLLGDRGHHRLTIDPASANARAIHVYESIGFKPVGVMRQYERGRDGVWRDALLMDLLAGELVEA